ncbi:MAG: hypothetical protein JW725_02590, partial [Candidatus Babeliaceae bacterium]|nr:hypothetical protein [Candidatus Babeliaceae bacterium]
EQDHQREITESQSTHNTAAVTTTRGYLQQLYNGYGFRLHEDFEEQFRRILTALGMGADEYLAQVASIMGDDRIPFAYTVQGREIEGAERGEDREIKVPVGVVFRLLVMRTCDLSMQEGEGDSSHIATGPVSRLLGLDGTVHLTIDVDQLKNILETLALTVQDAQVCATGVSNTLLHSMIGFDPWAKKIIQSPSEYILRRLRETLAKGLPTYLENLSPEQRTLLWEGWGDEENAAFGQMLEVVFSEAVRTQLLEEFRRILAGTLSEAVLHSYFSVEDSLAYLEVPQDYQAEYLQIKLRTCYQGIFARIDGLDQRTSTKEWRTRWIAIRDELLGLLRRYDQQRQDQPLYDLPRHFIQLLTDYLGQVERPSQEILPDIPQEISTFLEDFPLPYVNIFAAMDSLDPRSFARLLDQVVRDLPKLKRLIASTIAVFWENREAELHLESQAFVAIVLYALAVRRTEWAERFEPLLSKAIEFFRGRSDQAFDEEAFARS